MYCPQCGKSNKEGSDFCIHCGKALLDKNVQAIQETKLPTSDDSQSKSFKLKKGSGWIGGFITAGIIWTEMWPRAKTVIDEVALLAIVILSWIFYYRLKAKIKFAKSSIVRSLTSAIVVMIVAAFVFGVFSAIL